jgi:uncharacterized membrane protein
VSRSLLVNLLGLVLALAALAHLTGLSSDEAVYLRTVAGDVSFRGLLLAGMVIGRELFRAAVAVGHDQIAATVNTLVLAYAGASLPVLLVLASARSPSGTR